MGDRHLNEPIVGMAATPDGRGYYLVASDGGIFAFGDAGFVGSTGGLQLNRAIVGMAVDPATGGYWLVASDGGIFSFGAPFRGSMGDRHLNAPIVGMAATADGGGYYLVASDGGVFAFGDARFAGSTGGTNLTKPVVGMAATADGRGYWLVASDGGIFSFGAPFLGSTGAVHLVQPIVGMVATGMGGYYLAAADGGIFTFGDAGFCGSAGGGGLNQPIVGIAAGLGSCSPSGAPRIAGLGLQTETSGTDLSPVPVAGVTIGLSATVQNASSCTLSATPPIKGLPVTTTCPLSAFSRWKGRVSLPSIGTLAPQTVTLALTATGRFGSATATLPVTVLPGWSPHAQVVQGDFPLNPMGVTCAPSSEFCLAASPEYDGAPKQQIEIYDNGVWSATTVPAWSAASCATLTFCMVVASSSASIYTGTWSSGAAPAGLNSVSCPVAGMCVATDGSGGHAYTFANGGWGAAVSVDPTVGGEFGPISCASITLCVATDNLGRAFVDTGGTWSSPTNLTGASNGTTNPVSCTPASQFCMVLIPHSGSGGADHYMTYNSGFWGASGATDTGSGGASSAVSCPSVGLCVGLGTSDANPITSQIYAGSAWSTPYPIAPLVTSIGIAEYQGGMLSCASTSFCMSLILQTSPYVPIQPFSLDYVLAPFSH
jgi:hypothetical protein